LQRYEVDAFPRPRRNSGSREVPSIEDSPSHIKLCPKSGFSICAGPQHRPVSQMLQPLQIQLQPGIGQCPRCLLAMLPTGVVHLCRLLLHSNTNNLRPHRNQLGGKQVRAVAGQERRREMVACRPRWKHHRVGRPWGHLPPDPGALHNSPLWCCYHMGWGGREVESYFRLVTAAATRWGATSDNTIYSAIQHYSHSNCYSLCNWRVFPFSAMHT